MQYAITIFISLLLNFSSCRQTNEFVFKCNVADYGELSTQTEIYLDSAKVGELLTVELSPGQDFLYGKLRFKDHFSVYSNMQFINEPSLIARSVIRITTDTESRQIKLDPKRDTVLIKMKR